MNEFAVHGSRFTVCRSPFTVHRSLFTVPGLLNPRDASVGKLRSHSTTAQPFSVARRVDSEPRATTCERRTVNCEL